MQATQDKQVWTRLDAELYERIQQRAKEFGLSTSDYVRLVLKTYIDSEIVLAASSRKN